MINPIADPVATYLDIQKRIESATDDDVYSGPEMARDLARLLLAARTLIQRNAVLSERAINAERIAMDAQVDLLSKDIEIHELKGNNT